MSKARDYAKRTACASNLRNIGVALRSYIGERNDRLPYASFMPSLSPLPLETEESIYISDVLKKRLGNEIDVFECPSDYSGSVRADPNNGLSYFHSERSSYEYRVQFGGGTMAELSNRFSRRGRIVADNMIWIMRDYDNFHAPAGKIVYRDFHGSVIPNCQYRKLNVETIVDAIPFGEKTEGMLISSTILSTSSTVGLAVFAFRRTD